MQALTGGSSQSSKSGYSALPSSIQKEFNPFAAAINYFTLPQFGTPNTTIPGQASTTPRTGGGKGGKSGAGAATAAGPSMMGGNPGVNSMFTPLGVSANEQAAMDRINHGFAPTEESLRADIGMQMNPFNDSVINQINQQGQGQFSMLNQALNNSGQNTTSNRYALGANDIDLSRMNQIGGFLQGQYNTSLNNAMNVLPGQRTADAQNQLSIGDFLRKLDMQTKQAPITALQAGTSLMSPFVSGGSSSGSSTGGLLPALAGFAKAVP